MSVNFVTSEHSPIPEQRIPGTGWTERYMGGSKAAEDRMIEDWVRRIEAVQANLAVKNERAPMRALHAKTVAAPTATFRVLNEPNPREIAQAGFRSGLPQELKTGLFTPGKTYDNVCIRFSNASGEVHPDGAKDFRGAAIRIRMPDGKVQDLLMTNAAASFARNPAQQVGVTEAAANKLTLLPKLISSFGLREGIRILVALTKTHEVTSFAGEQFWSRAPFRLGPYAFKFKIEPAVAPKPLTGLVRPTSDFLHDDLRLRLALGSVMYKFRVQFFSDEESTPIEDGTVEWKTPFVTVAELNLPKQDLDSASLKKVEEEVDRLGFSPANHVGLVGIGSLNRTRAAVYAGDQKGRDADLSLKCPMGH